MLTDDGDPFFLDLPVDERVYVAPVVARNTSTNGVSFPGLVETGGGL